MTKPSLNSFTDLELIVELRSRLPDSYVLKIERGVFTDQVYVVHTGFYTDGLGRTIQEAVQNAQVDVEKVRADRIQKLQRQLDNLKDPA